MDTIVALCHHSSHPKVLDSFLNQFSKNYTVKFMTIPDQLYTEGTTQIDYRGSISDKSTYATIPAGSVTAYINMFCFQQIPNIQEGFQEIDKTLKPGGYYVFSKMNLPTANQPLNDLAKDYFKSKGYSLSGPIKSKATETQPDQHVELTDWFILQKPLKAGKRKTKRSKRKTRKGYKK